MCRQFIRHVKSTFILFLNRSVIKKTSASIILIYMLSHLIGRTIDLLDWNSLINDTTRISNLLMVPNVQVSRVNMKWCQGL